MSKVQATGIDPRLLTRPAVGRRPQQPFSAAGIRTEPPVSVPSVAAARSAPIAAPDPPLEPPLTRVVSHGLWTSP